MEPPGGPAAHPRQSRVSGLTLALRGELPDPRTPAALPPPLPGAAVPAPAAAPTAARAAPSGAGVATGAGAAAAAAPTAAGLAAATAAAAGGGGAVGAGPVVGFSRGAPEAPGAELRASGTGGGAPAAEAKMSTGDAAQPGQQGGKGEKGRDPRAAAVIEEFERWQAAHPDLALASAAIHALTGAIRGSQASTMMGLEREMRDACATLRTEHAHSLSIHAACDLFMCFVTREMSDDLARAKQNMLKSAEQFAKIASNAREKAAWLGQEFIANGTVLLTHGFSRTVLAVCRAATAKGKYFRVVVTEAGGDGSGQRTAAELSAMGVPVTLVQDCAVGRAMPRCDLVLLGADGVAESGGVVNRVGTFQIAVVAKALGKPLYVAAESFKFAQMFPLDQEDWAGEEKVSTGGAAPAEGKASGAPGSEQAQLISRSQYEYDYTPPELLTLLFTDVGVLTPSAVSVELMRMYL